jgi:hypothetical protein
MRSDSEIDPDIPWSSPPAPRSDRFSPREMPFWPYEPTDFQRLIVNPFLLVGLPCLIWGAVALFHLLHGQALAVFLVGSPALFLLFRRRLLRWHCLDCGKSGPLRNHRQHWCAKVLERAEARGELGFGLISADTQVKIWLWTFILGGLLVVCLHAALR